MPRWVTVVVDDTARSEADAKIKLDNAIAADYSRRGDYALRYDGGKYVVIRRDRT